MAKAKAGEAGTTVALTGTFHSVTLNGEVIHPVGEPEPPDGEITPGQIAAPTTDTLTGTDGKWGFAATGDVGLRNYDVLLDGASAATARAVLIQVVPDGTGYIKNSESAWYKWNGSAFEPSSQPGNGGGPKPPDPPPTGEGDPQPIPPTGAEVSPGQSIQSAINNTPSGKAVILKPGHYTENFKLKSEIMLLAEPGTTLTGNVDMSGLGNATFRGRTPGALVMDKGRVLASGSQHCFVGCMKFNGAPSAGYDGGCISLPGSIHLSIINIDLEGCDGNQLGMYDWDHVLIDGARLHNCAGQIVSASSSTSTQKGRNIKMLRSVLDGFGRAGFETAGTIDGTANTPGHHFLDLVIDQCMFINYYQSFNAHPAAAPVSLVPRTLINGKVTNNWFEKGPYSGYTEGCEINSDASQGGTPCDTSGNTFVDINAPFPTYGSAGQNAKGNFIWNASGPIPAGNTVLTAKPTRPALPARINW